MEQLDPAVVDFYRGAMRALLAAEIPFLVGGAYAFERYTGIARHSKDFDIFAREADVVRALDVLGRRGCDTELTFRHWLGKARRGAHYIDVIYSSGNGIAIVDDRWFAHAVPSKVLGVMAQLIPAEEMIWSKAFVMERERYDGGDVAHLLHARTEALDWRRLLERFGHRWRVLYVHLILFGFIYPGERDRIPSWVLRQLTARMLAELADGAGPDPLLCQGTVLSREQFLPDLAGGYEDARTREDVQMTDTDIDRWTEGIADDGEAARHAARGGRGPPGHTPKRAYRIPRSAGLG